MDKPIVVFGPIAYDDIETRYGRVEKILGGCGAYTSVVVSSYELGCSLISRVGKDFQESDQKFLISKGVSLDYLELDRTDNTLFWSGRYSDDFSSRKTKETKVGVFTKYNPIVPKQLRNTEILCLGNCLPELQLSVWNQYTQKPRLTVMDTMDYWIENQSKQLQQMLQKANLLCINNEEAYSLTNEHNPHLAAQKLLKMGPQYLIIKLGGNGSFLFHKDQYHYTPAYKVEKVKDPTGAGDCFLGGFVGYLYQTKDYSFENMKIAMQHGTVSASFVVEDFGLKNLIHLTKESKQYRLKEYTSLNQSVSEPGPEIYERFHQA